MINSVTTPSALINAAKGEGFQRDPVKEATRDFEAVFITQMIGHMFNGIKTDSVFGGGASEGIFRNMLLQEYGKEMSKGDGIGISNEIQKVILQMQER